MQCVPLTGKGFVPGAYHCVCNDGFYFPDLTSEVKAYTGEQIERWIRSTGETVTTQFRCDACAAGCETCIDDSPCLHQRNEGLIITLLILNLIAVIGIIAIAIATYLYRHEMVSFILRVVFFNKKEEQTSLCIRYLLLIIDNHITKRQHMSLV